MMRLWRLLAIAAALNVTAGACIAAAQTVIVRHAPPGVNVELLLDDAVVATGTAGPAGDVSLDLKMPEPGEMDANVYADVCEKMRRVLVVDRNRRPPPPPAGCERREISGLFLVRRVHTLVIDIGGLQPSMLLVKGKYTPPKPVSADGEERVSTVAATGGVPAGPARVYGLVGGNYHQSTLNLTETIDAATQTFAQKTHGWSWLLGGGTEVWVTPKVALYGEVSFAKIKGKAEDKGEGLVDDRLRVVAGARLLLIPPHLTAPPTNRAQEADARIGDAKRVRDPEIDRRQVRLAMPEGGEADFAIARVLLAAGNATRVAAPSREAIRYTLRFPPPQL